MRTFIFVFLFTVVLCLFSAHARIGETPVQAQKRYGAVVSEESKEAFRIQKFSKSSFTVSLYYTVEKEWLFGVERAAAVSYIKPDGKRKENTELTDEELKKFLDVNVPEEDEWVETDFNALLVKAKDKKEREKLVKEQKRYRLWKSRAGSKAYYLKKTNELFITTTDKIPLPDAEKEPHYLDGF